MLFQEKRRRELRRKPGVPLRQLRVRSQQQQVLRAGGDALAEELADVALYLLQLAYLAGIDLEQAILDKLAINYSRDWSEE